MRKEYENVSYELLRPSQVKAIKAHRPIAYIPLGSLEWHGKHNPLGTDGLKAHSVCCEAALRYGGVVLPPFYHAIHSNGSWGPEGWEGYTLDFNEEDMLRSAMAGTCRSLVCSGWRVLVGITGHDVPIHRQILSEAIESATDGKTSCGFAMYEGELHTPDDEISLSMDHAGAWETSSMMYAYPGKVDLGPLKGYEQVDRFSCDFRKRIFGTEGISGMNPLRYASPDMGGKIIKKMGELIGRKAYDLLNTLIK